MRLQCLRKVIDSQKHLMPKFAEIAPANLKIEKLPLTSSAASSKFLKYKKKGDNKVAVLGNPPKLSELSSFIKIK